MSGYYTARQKDSFYNAKGLLLKSKRTPFEEQKDSFWNAKGLLLQHIRVCNEEVYVQTQLPIGAVHHLVHTTFYYRISRH